MHVYLVYVGVQEQFANLIDVVRSDFELQKLVLSKNSLLSTLSYYLCKSFKFQFVAFCLSNQRIDCLFVDGQLFLFFVCFSLLIKRFN